jgi:cytochrome c-type biogenesis protein CcmH/NrfG
VGLITGLLTLPLAPVRATAWVAEQVRAQAEREYYDEERIRDRLTEVDEARAAGVIDGAEAARMEDELLELLLEARERGY